jgi:hypothetical protein
LQNRYEVVAVPCGDCPRDCPQLQDGLEIIVIGAPHLGEAPRDDVEGKRDWWAD